MVCGKGQEAVGVRRQPDLQVRRHPTQSPSLLMIATTVAYPDANATVGAVALNACVSSK